MQAMSNIRASCFGLLAAALVALSGCGEDSHQGSVSVAITDAPVDDAQEVWIQVTGVAFKPQGAASEIVEEFAPRAINLLRYQQGDVAVLLDNVPMEAGKYEWLRLMVESEPNVRDSYIVLNGHECELRVPSGAESGLKMNRGFSIEAGGSLALTIDFDLRQSLHAPPGQPSGTDEACTQGYILRPTLRLVDNANVGAVAGTVTFDGGVVPAGCVPKVYLLPGAAVPDDVEDSTDAVSDIDPVSVVTVDIPPGASQASYQAAFLPAGEYTAAFTCTEDTDADETLNFVPPDGIAVTVQRNLISTVDFAVPAD